MTRSERDGPSGGCVCGHVKDREEEDVCAPAQVHVCYSIICQLGLIAFPTLIQLRVLSLNELVLKKKGAQTYSVIVSVTVDLTGSDV